MRKRLIIGACIAFLIGGGAVAQVIPGPLPGQYNTIIAALNTIITGINSVVTAIVAGYLTPPIATKPSAAPTTIVTGSIVSGLVFQQIVTSNAARLSFEYQNDSSDPCYIFYGATASATTTTSLKVPANSYYGRTTGSIPSDGIQTTCTTTADLFWATVQ